VKLKKKNPVEQEFMLRFKVSFPVEEEQMQKVLEAFFKKYDIENCAVTKTVQLAVA